MGIGQNEVANSCVQTAERAGGLGSVGGVHALAYGICIGDTDERSFVYARVGTVPWSVMQFAKVHCTACGDSWRFVEILGD